MSIGHRERTTAWRRARGSAMWLALDLGIGALLWGCAAFDSVTSEEETRPAGEITHEQWRLALSMALVHRSGNFYVIEPFELAHHEPRWWWSLRVEPRRGDAPALAPLAARIGSATFADGASARRSFDQLTVEHCAAEGVVALRVVGDAWADPSAGYRVIDLGMERARVRLDVVQAETCAAATRARAP